jgi:hypothetical protein
VRRDHGHHAASLTVEDRQKTSAKAATPADARFGLVIIGSRAALTGAVDLVA